MPLNPFIQLLDHPIITLTLAGYAIAMLFLTLGGTAIILRDTTKLIIMANRQHRQGHGNTDEWWGEYADGWLPPWQWMAKLGKVSFFATLLVWSLATIVYMVT